MPRISLPPDLVHLIAEHLHDDTRALAFLCLLDKESLNLMTPLLYKAVHLSATQSISQFCDAVIQSERSLGIYPTSIHFELGYSYSDEYLPHLIESIQNTLYQTPNLVDLALGIHTPNQIDLRLHRHLALHPPPFSLHRLACRFTPDLMPFLSAQTSIRTISFYPRISGPYASADTPSHSSLFLPYLKSIKADLSTAMALLPGRPVSHVDIPVIFGQSPHSFCARLDESTAPEGIESLSTGLFEENFWIGILELIVHLKEVCGASLRELKVKVGVLPSVHIQNVSGFERRMGGY